MCVFVVLFSLFLHFLECDQSMCVCCAFKSVSALRSDSSTHASMHVLCIMYVVVLMCCGIMYVVVLHRFLHSHVIYQHVACMCIYIYIYIYTKNLDFTLWLTSARVAEQENPAMWRLPSLVQLLVSCSRKLQLPLLAWRVPLLVSSTPMCWYVCMCMCMYVSSTPMCWYLLCNVIRVQRESNRIIFITQV